jgi:integrase
VGRPIAKLSALKVERSSKIPGVYSDGGNLELHVNSKNASSWVFRYAAPHPFVSRTGTQRPAGKQREMGIGPYPAVSLEQARIKAGELRTMLANRIDPLEQREVLRQADQRRIAQQRTFRQVAEAFIATNESQWKNAKHRQQWRNTLASYAYPKFGDLPVTLIDTTLVKDVLEQPVPAMAGKVAGTLWTARPETAVRLRQRIEMVLDAAKTEGLRTGDNPARWAGHLENVLPKPPRGHQRRHHAALPYAEVAAFMETLGGQDGVAARALRFLILTAARTGEVIGATWGEIDTEAAEWSIPGERMKAGRPHRVPLSAGALALMGDRKSDATPLFALPNGKPLSNMALLALLRRLGRDDVTAHGFRSTFRTWAALVARAPREVAETALAHSVGPAVERSYLRTEFMELRRPLMETWATFCATRRTPADVIPLRAAEAG